MKDEKPSPAVPPLLAGILKPATGIPAAATNPPVAVESSTAAAADIAAAALAGKRDERKNKGGRHPKGCNCGNCSQSNPNWRPENRKPRVAPPAELVSEKDRELAREAVKAVTHLLDSFALLAVDWRLKKIGADSAIVDMATEKAAMTTETRNGIVTTGTAVLEKYDALKFAPEVALGLYLTGWLSGIFTLLVQLGKTPAKPVSADDTKD